VFENRTFYSVLLQDSTKSIDRHGFWNYTLQQIKSHYSYIITDRAIVLDLK